MLLDQPLTLLYLFAFQFPFGLAEPQATGIDYIHGVISKHLQDSSVLLFTNNKDSLDYQIDTKVEAFLTAKSLKIIQTVQLVEYGVVKKWKLTFPKYAHIGKAIVSFISQEFDTAYFAQFTSILTNRHNELTRGDEDFYFFLTNSQSVSESILHSPINLHLRYFLVVTEIKTLGTAATGLINYTVNSFCFRCEENDKLKVLPTDENVEFIHIFLDFTKNFNNYPVRVVGPTTYIVALEIGYLEGTGYRLKRGIHVDFFKLMMQTYNFSYVVRPCSAGTTGQQLPNGTWNGCMGDVLYNKADYGMIVGYLPNRHEEIHYTSSYFYCAVKFVTSKPRQFYTWMVIYTAFHPMLWSIILLFLSITPIIMTFCENGLKLSKMEGVKQYSKIFYQLWSYLIGQGLDKPDKLSSNFVHVGWLLYGMVICWAYTSSLQALIVSPGYTNPPKNLNDLVNSNYEWGTSKKFYVGLGKLLFTSSPNPTILELASKMQTDEDDFSSLKKTLEIPYVSFNYDITYEFFGRLFEEHGSNPFQYAQDSVYFLSSTCITRRRETFRSNFNRLISTAVDTGIMKQIIKLDWYPLHLQMKLKFQTGGIKGNDGPIALSLQAVLGSFIILNFGIIVSTLVWILEKFAQKWSYYSPH